MEFQGASMQQATSAVSGLRPQRQRHSASYVQAGKLTGCTLCAAPGPGGDLPWETVLLEDEDFVVTPSIGSLVPGYVLIRSKRHVLCMGALDEAELSRLEKFADTIARRQERLFGANVVFEHGPAKKNESTGCTVDHAHWHVVPVADFVGARREACPGRAWRPLESLTDLADAHARGESYLFYDALVGKPLISRGEAFPSQLLRRDLSVHLGRPHEYNWRTHPFLENVQKTIEAYRQ